MVKVMKVYKRSEAKSRSTKVVKGERHKADNHEDLGYGKRGEKVSQRVYLSILVFCKVLKKILTSHPLPPSFSAQQIFQTMKPIRREARSFVTLRFLQETASYQHECQSHNA